MFGLRRGNIEKKRRYREDYRGKRDRRTSPFCSPRPTPTPSPRTPIHAKRKGQTLPSKFKKKFERSRARVGYDSKSCSSISEAFQESSVYRNPYAPTFDTLREPIGLSRRLSSSYFELELEDGERIEDPCYLDLFQPGIPVVRDPKLDLPRKPKKLKRYIKSRPRPKPPSKKFTYGCAFVLFIIIFICLILLFGLLYPWAPYDPRVTPPTVMTATACGLVVGRVTDYGYAFDGIPYAVAPIGTERFKPSKSQDTIQDCWMGTHHANLTKPCWGFDSKGDPNHGHENCLLLDIYTPQLGYENPLPVIIVVGGDSLSGDPRRRDLLKAASYIAKTRRVVIVSPQIRRSLFGFFPSPLIAQQLYPHTAGNQASSDLFASLVWVRRNIEHFGGNKNQVTLLGHQAGGSLVWGLLSKGHITDYISSAWISSASLAHPFIWRHASHDLKKPFKCSDFDCLLNLSSKDVMDGVSTRRRLSEEHWLYSDGVYVPFDELTPRIPIMFGSTEQSFANKLYLNREDIKAPSKINTVLQDTLSSLRSMNIDPTPRLYRHYRPPKNVSVQADVQEILTSYAALYDNPWLLLTTSISDASVTCPMLLKAKSLARSWEHSVPSSLSFKPPIYAYVSEYQRSFMGAADAWSDIEAIFGVFGPRNTADETYVKAMQELFFNFVHVEAPERYHATPANNGIYIVKEGFTLQKTRVYCEMWNDRQYYRNRH